MENRVYKRNYKRGNSIKNSNRKTEIATEVRRVLLKQQERKFLSTVTAGFSTTTPPAFFAISQPIIQGTGGAQRIGDIIRLKKLVVNMTISQDPAVSALETYVRSIIFLDKQNNGTVPAGTDILDIVTITSAFSPEQQKEKRFHIIADWVDILDKTVNTGRQHKRVYKLDNDCYYNGVTSVTGANGKNSLWYMVFSQGIGGGTLPIVDFDMQVHFTDS